MARTAHAALLQREASAVALHAAGRSYDEIASELGYAGRGGAYKAVDRGLKKERDRRAGEFLQTQLDRLEAVLCAHWPAGVDGHDVAAANLLLTVLAQMNHLLGLDRQDRRGGRKPPIKPWGIVMTDEERGQWEAAGSPLHWDRPVG